MQSACAVLHFHLWLFQLFDYFPHRLINGALLKIKSVFWFSLKLLSETSLILRIQRDTITNVHRSSCKVNCSSYQTLIKLNSSDRFSRKAQISNFVKIRRVEAQLSMRANRHDEASSSFSQFWERAYKRPAGQRLRVQFLKVFITLSEIKHDSCFQKRLI
jgi:hypothetical protein